MSKTKCVNCGEDFIERVIPINNTYVVKVMMCDNEDCKFYHVIRMV